MSKLIDADALKQELLNKGFYPAIVRRAIERAPAVDAVQVVRCEDCRWAKPYERNDGLTGYYCNFCGHAFQYGTNWERLFTPVKEADDFCSCGERR